MFDNPRSHRIYIGPQWGRLCIFLAFSIILGWFVVIDIQVRAPRTDMRFLLALCIICFIYNGKSYRLNDKSICLCFIRVPIWNIHWNNVQELRLIPRKGTGIGSRYGEGSLIIIRLVGCSEFKNSLQTRKFLFNNLGKVLCIDLPTGKEQNYISQLEKYSQIRVG